MNQLLNKDKTERIGAQGGATEILQHPWFADMDRGQVEQRTFEVEFVPEPFSIENSAKYFTMESTKKVLNESVLTGEQIDKINGENSLF